MSFDPDEDNGPPFPLGVRIAGWIWILTGGMGGVSSIAVLFLA